MQLESWQRWRWHKDTRYYEATVQQDLWGHWLLTRVWGRRGSAVGQVRHTPCENYAQALALLQATAKRRSQRSYVRVD